MAHHRLDRVSGIVDVFCWRITVKPLPLIRMLIVLQILQVLLPVVLVDTYMSLGVTLPSLKPFLNCFRGGLQVLRDCGGDSWARGLLQICSNNCHSASLGSMQHRQILIIISYYSLDCMYFGSWYPTFIKVWYIRPNKHLDSINSALKQLQNQRFSVVTLDRRHWIHAVQ